MGVPHLARLLATCIQLESPLRTSHEFTEALLCPAAAIVVGRGYFRQPCLSHHKLCFDLQRWQYVARHAQMALCYCLYEPVTPNEVMCFQYRIKRVGSQRRALDQQQDACAAAGRSAGLDQLE